MLEPLETSSDEDDLQLGATCLVMLVDDQPMVAEALRRILAPEIGIDFHYCREPGQAVKIAEQIKPTIILLDLVMPDIDGLSVLSALRANLRTKNFPVVMLSSTEDPKQKAAAFTAGGNDYLIKWPDRIELLARIRYHSQCYIALKQRDDAFRALRVSQRKLAETNLQLQRLASHDGLTNIPNRRHFDECLNEEWYRATREQSWLAVAMLDIDHFKQFNDLYGHLAGDACIQAVVKAVSSCLKRPTDMVARYGGEEFVLILPGTQGEGALGLCESIRQAVEALQITHEKSSVGAYVTLSIGVAVLIPERDSPASALLAAADAALYTAKSEGRNRAVLASAATA